MGNKALLILFGVTLAITSANSIENPIIIDDDTVVIGGTFPLIPSFN